MKALDEHDRVPNFNKHGDPTAHCPVCGDDGWVPVVTRQISSGFRPNGTRIDPGPADTVEEMAPCPFCVRGYRQEFPVIPAEKAKADTWIKPPWGEDGWWRGREIPQDLVDEFRAPPERLLNPAEQMEKLRQLGASVGLRSMDIDEEPVQERLVTNETAFPEFKPIGQ